MGTPVVGVRLKGATSSFDRVTVGLGSAQAGCGGVTGLSSRWGTGMGLAKGDRGLGGVQTGCEGMCGVQSGLAGVDTALRLMGLRP